MTGPNNKVWRELCAAIEKEKKPQELDRLLDELIRSLDESQRSPAFPKSAWKRERIQ
jgi:hypothetical protein